MRSGEKPNPEILSRGGEVKRQRLAVGMGQGPEQMPLKSAQVILPGPGLKLRQQVPHVLDAGILPIARRQTHLRRIEQPAIRLFRRPGKIALPDGNKHQAGHHGENHGSNLCGSQ